MTNFFAIRSSKKQHIEDDAACTEKRDRFADSFKGEHTLYRRYFGTIKIDFAGGKVSDWVLGGIQKISSLDVFVEQGVTGID